MTRTATTNTIKATKTQAMAIKTTTKNNDNKGNNKKDDCNMDKNNEESEIKNTAKKFSFSPLKITFLNGGYLKL